MHCLPCGFYYRHFFGGRKGAEGERGALQWNRVGKKKRGAVAIATRRRIAESGFAFLRALRLMMALRGGGDGGTYRRQESSGYSTEYALSQRPEKARQSLLRIRLLVDNLSLSQLGVRMRW